MEFTNRKNKQCRQGEIVTDTENKQTVARGKEEGVGEKLVRDFKRYNLPVAKKKKKKVISMNSVGNIADYYVVSLNG